MRVLRVAAFSFRSEPQMLVSSERDPEMQTVVSEGHPIPTTRLSFVEGFFATPFSSVLVTLVSYPPVSVAIHAFKFEW